MFTLSHCKRFFFHDPILPPGAALLIILLNIVYSSQITNLNKWLSRNKRDSSPLRGAQEQKLGVKHRTRAQAFSGSPLC